MWYVHLTTKPDAVFKPLSIFKLQIYFLDKIVLQAQLVLIMHHALLLLVPPILSVLAI